MPARTGQKVQSSVFRRITRKTRPSTWRDYAGKITAAVSTARLAIPDEAREIMRKPPGRSSRKNHPPKAVSSNRIRRVS